MLLAAKLSELSRNFSWQQLLTSVIEKSSEFHTQLTKFASFYSLMSWESSQRKRSNDNMLKSTKKQSQLCFLLFFFRDVREQALVFVFYSRPQLSFNWTNSRRFFILILLLISELRVAQNYIYSYWMLDVASLFCRVMIPFSGEFMAPLVCKVMHLLWKIHGPITSESRPKTWPPFCYWSLKNPSFFLLSFRDRKQPRMS